MIGSLDPIRSYRIQRRISWPGYPLTLSMTKNGSNQKSFYNLIAVCVNTGSLSGGHYFTYARHHLTNKWYCFDDRSITPIIDESCIVTQNAYILFYVRSSSLVWVFCMILLFNGKRIIVSKRKFMNLKNNSIQIGYWYKHVFFHILLLLLLFFVEIKHTT